MSAVTALVLLSLTARAATATDYVAEGAVTFLAGSTVATGSTDGTGAVARFTETRDCVRNTTAAEIVYVSDKSVGNVRQVNITSGEVTTLAGVSGGSAAEGGPGTGNLGTPIGMHLNTFHEPALFVTDTSHRVIKIVIATSYVSFFAGSGTSGNVDATGTAAQFVLVADVTGDPTASSIFVADYGGHNLRVIGVADAVVTTVAGSTAGASGTTDATGTAARFNQPRTIAFRTIGKSLFSFGDSENTLRRVGTADSYVVTTVAGDGSNADQPGVGTRAKIPLVLQLAMDNSGSYLYMAYKNSHRIGRFDVATMIVSHVVGDGSAAWAFSASPLSASIKSPTLVCVSGLTGDSSGGGTSKLVIGQAGLLSTVDLTTVQTSPDMRRSQLLAGGTGSGSTNGDISVAKFNTPTACSVDQNNGTVYIMDRDNRAIRSMLNPHTSPSGAVMVSTVFGNGGGYTDGGFGAAQLRQSNTVAYHANAAYFMSRNSGTLRRANLGLYTVETLAGQDQSYSLTNGVGTAARFGNNAEGIEINHPIGDTVYVADTGNHALRSFAMGSATVATHSGTGTSGSDDGLLAAAKYNGLVSGKYRPTTGVIYVLDSGNTLIRTADSTKVTTVAGTGSSGDIDGVGTAAALGSMQPSADFDASSSALYFVDSGADKIKRFAVASAVVETVIGFGTTFTAFSSINGVCMSHGYGPETLFVVGEHYIGMMSFVTSTATTTATVPPTATQTPTATASLPATNTATASSTASATASASLLQTGTATTSSTVSASATASHSASDTATVSITGSATASASRSASDTATASGTLTTTATPSRSKSESPSAATTTSTKSVSARTPTPSSSVTTSASLSTSRGTKSATPTSGTRSMSLSMSGSTTASETTSRSRSSSWSGSTSPSASTTQSVSTTRSASGSSSASTSTSASLSVTSTETASRSTSRSASGSPSVTISATVSATGSASPVPTRTSTPSASPTPSGSKTSLPSPSRSLEPTSSNEATETESPSRSVSAVVPAPQLDAGDPRLFFPALYSLTGAEAASRWQGKRFVARRLAAGSFRGARAVAWPVSGFGGQVRMHVANTLSSVAWSVAAGTGSCNLTSSDDPSPSSVTCARFRNCALASTLAAGGSLELRLAEAFTSAALCNGAIEAEVFVSVSGTFVDTPRIFAAHVQLGNAAGRPAGTSRWFAKPSTFYADGTTAAALLEGPAAASAAILDPTVAPGSASTGQGGVLSAASCVINDVQAFTAFTGAGLGPTASCQVSDSGTLRACMTVAEAMAECHASSDCVGFTSALRGTLSGAPTALAESPLHLHIGGDAGYQVVTSGNDVRRIGGAAALGLVFHRKATAGSRTCRFSTAAAGTFQVFLSQASMADGVAAVFAQNGTAGERQLATECGGAAPFAGSRQSGSRRGDYGRSGACDDLVLCAELPSLVAGSTVEIVAPSGMVPRDCDAALRVVATVTVDPPAVPARAVTLRAPLVFDESVPELQNVSYGFDHFDLATSLDSGAAVARTHVFVVDVLNVSAKVAQTGFECMVGNQGDLPPCPPNHAVAVRRGASPSGDSAALTSSTPPLIMACGGNESFSQRPGLSALCAREWDCQPLPVRAAPSGVFTGIVSVAADLALIGQATQAATVSARCAGFAGSLHVSGPSTTRVLRLGRFPLSAPAKGFEAFVAVPSDGPGAVALALSWAEREGYCTNVTRGLPGPFGLPRTLYRVHNATFPQNGSLIVPSPNVTHACVFDSVTTDRTCVSQVPQGAERLGVRVQQTDFETRAVTVTVRDSSGVTLDAKVCGGSDTELFVLDRGISGGCATWHSCIVESYLPDGAATVTVAVPAGLQPNGCDLALNAELGFSATYVPDIGNNTSTTPPPAIGCNRSTHFWCVANRGCIPRDAVCDGFRADCVDAVDELPCSDFRLAEADVVWSGTIRERGATVLPPAAAASSLSECRREAVFRGSGGFEYSWAASSESYAPVDPQCFVFAASDADSIVVDANAFKAGALNVSLRRSATYFRVADRDTYTACSVLLHCSGRGNLRAGSPGCACECETGWVGDNCNQRRSVGTPAGHFAVLSAHPELLIRAVYEKALEAGSAGVAVSAGSLVPFNASIVALEYSYTARSATALDAFENALRTQAKFEAVNGVLEAAGFPLVVALFESDVTNVLAAVGSCANAEVANTTRSLCTIAGTPVATNALRITTTGYGATPQVVVRADAEVTPLMSTQRRQTSSTIGNGTNDTVAGNGTELIALECTTENAVVAIEDDTSACNPTVCALSLPRVRQVSAVTVLPSTLQSGNFSTENASNAVLSSTLCSVAPTTSLAVAPSTDEPPLVADSVRTDQVRVENAGYLTGGATTIAAATIAVLFVIFVLRASVLRFVRAREVVVGQMAFLAQLPTWVTRSAVHDQLRTKYKVDLAAVLVALAVLAALLLAVMGLMWVMWAQSRDLRSDSAAVVTFFDGPLCAGGDAVRTLPFQATSIAATAKCGALVVVGATRSALYGRSRCDSPDAVLGSVAMTAAEADCDAAPLVTVGRGECVALSSIMPSSEVVLPGVYVTVSCVPSGQGGTYSSFLADLASPAPQDRRFAARDTEPDITDAVAPAIVRQPYTTLSSSGESSSTAANVLAAFATFSDVSKYVTAPSDKDHVAVFQARGSVGGAPTSAAEREVFDTAVVETGLTVADATGQMSPAQLRQFPRTLPGSAYPAGYIFNGFGTANEAAGSAAVLGAQRYLGMRDSAFDLGLDFGPSENTQFDAFAISLWLKASSRTQGFAFVLADHYEVLGRGAGTGPVLVERLRQMVLDGPATSRPWFNESFSVYASLYVNGASRTLTFAMMAPLRGAPSVAKGTEQVMVQWSLDAMDQAHILDSGWHHVTLALQNQKKKPFVAIILDGKSSLSSNEWRKCLTRRPSPLEKLAEIAVDAEPIKVSATSEGVMYVGFLNGGVQGVTFRPIKAGPAGAVRGGTVAMRNERALRRVSFESIAYGLFICACLAFCLVAYSVRNMWVEAEDEQREDMDAARAVYAETLRLLYTKEFHPLTFDAAARTVGADDTTFAALVQECAHSPLDDPDDESSSKLVRALYLSANEHLLVDEVTGKPASVSVLRSRRPTPAMWAAFVQSLDAGSLVSAAVLAEVDAALEEEEEEAAEAAAAADGKSKKKKKKKKKKNAKLRVKLKVKVRTGDQSKRSGGRKSRGQNQNVRAVKPDPGTVFLSVVGTLQVAAVYMDTWTVPALYQNWIQPILNIFGLDFLQYAFSDPLAGPILQLCVATLLLCGLAFVLVRDDVNFYRNLLRYQHRRDRVEETPNAISERALNVLLRKIDPDFIIEQGFVEEVSVNLMRGEERAAAELFIREPRLRELEIAVGGEVAYIRKPDMTVHSSPDPNVKPKHRLSALPRSFVERVAFSASKMIAATASACESTALSASRLVPMLQPSSTPVHRSAESPIAPAQAAAESARGSDDVSVVDSNRSGDVQTRAEAAEGAPASTAISPTEGTFDRSKSSPGDSVITEADPPTKTPESPVAVGSLFDDTGDGLDGAAADAPAGGTPCSRVLDSDSSRAESSQASVIVGSLFDDTGDRGPAAAPDVPTGNTPCSRAPSANSASPDTESSQASLIIGSLFDDTGDGVHPEGGARPEAAAPRVDGDDDASAQGANSSEHDVDGATSTEASMRASLSRSHASDATPQAVDVGAPHLPFGDEPAAAAAAVDHRSEQGMAPAVVADEWSDGSAPSAARTPTSADRPASVVPRSLAGTGVDVSSPTAGAAIVSFVKPTTPGPEQIPEASASTNFAVSTMAAHSPDDHRMHLDATGEPLQLVTGMCLIHPKETLVSEMQSNVYPYNTRRTCCIVEDGKRCGTYAGQIFHCPHTNDDGEEDCGYCLCERHMQAGLWSHIKIMAWNGVRRFTKKGPVWLFYYFVVTVALGTYIPVMRTAVMMLSCHPLYQCVFPGCYNKPTQQYVASVYLAALLVLVFGVGFPFGLYQVLRRRQAIMADVFASPFYLGKFLQPVPVFDTHYKNARTIVTAASTKLSELLRRRVLAPCFAFLRREERPAVDGAFANVATAEGSGAETPMLQLPVVSLAELCERDRDTALMLTTLDVASPAAAVKPRTEDAEVDAQSADASDRDDDELRHWIDESRRAGRPASDTDNVLLDVATAETAPNPRTADAADDSLRRRVSFAPGADADNATASTDDTIMEIDDAEVFANTMSMAEGRGAGSSSQQAADASLVAGSEFATDGATVAADRAALQDMALLNSPVLGFPNGVIMKLQNGLVSLAEYRRFIMSDDSAMILLYAQIKFESIHLVPALSCGRFLLLIPPLVLEPNSIEQIAAIATGEIFFSVFLAAYAPYHSMWMVIVVLLGNIHQFILVGLKAYVTAVSHERDANPEVGPVMVATTLSFLVVTLAIFLIMMAGDALVEAFVEWRLGRLMTRLGVSRPKSAPLFIAPVKQPIVLEPTALPQVDASSDEDADYEADDFEASGKETAVLRELQAWKAHKNAVLERERKRRRELRSAEAQEQAIGMS